ncbi:MAG: hypothetical protein R6U91_03900 [Bacillota bacterium]
MSEALYERVSRCNFTGDSLDLAVVGSLATDGEPLMIMPVGVPVE